MSKQVADRLRAAANLIEPEGRWTQHVYARDRFGLITFSSWDAVCFCALGAISFSCGRPPAVGAGIEEHRFLRSAIDDTIPEWNDAPKRTQAEVVAKLREAADVAEATLSASLNRADRPGVER